MAKDIVFRIADIARRQRRIEDLMDKIMRLHERNGYELQELLKDLGVGKKSLNESLGGFVSPGRRREKIDKKRRAKEGVHSLEIGTGDDDSVIVRVAKGNPFPMSALLGKLLVFLSTAENSPDDKVGWRSRHEIAEHLAKAKGGWLPESNAVSNLVYRLRRIFEAHDANEELIQTNKKLGYRFALRRDGDLRIE